MAPEDRGRICFAYVFACVIDKPQRPPMSPMADDVITQGGIGGLKSLVYICGATTDLKKSYKTFQSLFVDTGLNFVVFAYI